MPNLRMGKETKVTLLTNLTKNVEEVGNSLAAIIL